MQLCFESVGQGKPLVILHGLLGSLDNWRTVSRALANRGGVQVFTVDLRNHGLSPHSAEMNYPVMVEDLRELLDREGLERVGWLGHSLGGKVAMEFALRYPDRIDRLLVSDIAPRAYPPTHDPVFEALGAVDLEACSSRQEVESALAPRLPDRVLRQFLLKGIGRQAAGTLAWKFNLAAIRDNYAKLSAALADGRVCAAPALFLRGGASDYIRDEDHHLIHRWFPQAVFHTFPGVGHWPHFEAPADFLRVVSDYLRD